MLCECFSCHTTSTELVSEWWPCALERHIQTCFPRAPDNWCGKSGAKNLERTLMKCWNKSEYLLSTSGLSYILPTNMTFLDTVAVNVYCSASMQKMTCDFFLFLYLITVFQLGTIGRMSCKCEEMWAVNCADLDVHHIIVCYYLILDKSPLRGHLKSQ